MTKIIANHMRTEVIKKLKILNKLITDYIENIENFSTQKFERQFFYVVNNLVLTFKLKNPEDKVGVLFTNIREAILVKRLVDIAVDITRDIKLKGCTNNISLKSFSDILRETYKNLESTIIESVSINNVNFNKVMHPLMRIEVLETLKYIIKIEHIDQDDLNDKFFIWSIINDAINILINDLYLDENPEESIGFIFANYAEIEALKTVISSINDIIDLVGVEKTNDLYLTSVHVNNLIQNSKNTYETMSSSKVDINLTEELDINWWC